MINSLLKINLAILFGDRTNQKKAGVSFHISIDPKGLRYGSLAQKVGWFLQVTQIRDRKPILLSG